MKLTRHVCVAVCCSVLQCVAVCCSVLQCVACVVVCCSVHETHEAYAVHHRFRRVRGGIPYGSQLIASGTQRLRG